MKLFKMKKAKNEIKNKKIIILQNFEIEKNHLENFFIQTT